MSSNIKNYPELEKKIETIFFFKLKKYVKLE